MNDRKKPSEHPAQTGLANIITDPMGSYTGAPIGIEEEPVQDADDL